MKIKKGPFDLTDWTNFWLVDCPQQVSVYTKFYFTISCLLVLIVIYIRCVRIYV